MSSPTQMTSTLSSRRILELEADSEENFEIDAKHFTAASVKAADVGMVQDVVKLSPQVGTIVSLQRRPEKSNSATESVSALDALERFMFTRKGESQIPNLTGKKFPAELPKDPC